jgi:non-hemolytic enterotoxin B/C
MQTDIGAFSDGFNSFFQPLLDLANKIVAGGDDQTKNVADFNEGLGELQKQVTSNRANVTEITTDLNAFQANLNTDYQNFLTDYNTAQTKIMGDGGEISQLNDQLQADQDAMNKDNSMIAGGCVMGVVGGLMIAVGALAEIETAGASTALIVGGVVVAAGGGVLIGEGTKDLIAKQNDYRDVSEQITTINNSIAALTTVKGQLDSFNNELANAIAAVGNVDKAWQTIGDSFTDLSTQLTSHIDTTSVFLVSEVTQAGSEWTDLKALIVNLETFHDIPTTPQTVAQATQTPAAQTPAA